MDVAFTATCVAFVRSPGGRLRVLLCVDRGDQQLFDGEPALLAEHRPGCAPEQLLLEGPDAVAVPAVQRVRALLAQQLVELLDQACDDAGEFHRERLVGRSVEFQAPAGVFDTPLDPGD